MTLRARLRLALACAAALPVLAHAATWYVAPSGSNTNAGTLSAPFQTLQKAHDVANPGDTIVLRGGVYVLTDAAVQIRRSGTSSAPITVQNHPGELPVLDGANITTSYRSAIQLSSASWWRIRGLEIRNAAAMGIYLTGSSNNNVVERNVVHHNVRIQGSGAGIQVSDPAANNLIVNNDSHHNGKYGTSAGDGIGNSSMQPGNVIRGNRTWRNNDDGIDLWNGRYALVEHNWSWENGKKDDLTASGGNGTGFKLGGGGASDGQHTVRNNLAWRNRANGFDDNSANLAMNVFNNTAWENGGSNYAFYSHVAFVLKNNVSVPRTSVLMAPEVAQQANSWNLPVTADTADFASLDYSGVLGPRLADGSLPALSFLKLATGSDLVDKGVDVGIAYSGAAPDLGAYEASAALPPPSGLRVVSP